MTCEEELAWAQAEHIARLADLEDRTPDGLKRAQNNAEARRKAAGLTRSQAARLVHGAGRVRRDEALRVAGAAGAVPDPAIAGVPVSQKGQR